MTRVDVAVVGGGIAGLAAAWTLRRMGREVALLEATDQVGGMVRTRRVGDYLIEEGPHSFLGRATPLWDLMAELGISGHAVAAQPPAWRFVHRAGKTRRLPVGLWSALSGNWLSTRGKLRAALEPFVPAGAADDESVRAFFARRFGEEVADGLVAPFVTGIYAGDAAQIGLADAFPALADFERGSGSVLRGAFGAKSRRARAGRRGLFSLRDGMATLPRALHSALEQTVSLNHPVQSLHRDDDVWVLGVSGAQEVRAKRVIIAAPPIAATQLIEPHGVQGLRGVQTCAMALVHLGGLESDGHARGFGALIPRGHGVRALGMLLTSSLFPGRAPRGRASTAVFFGGAQDPEAASLPDEQLVELALRARHTVFGSTLEPEMQTVVRWPRAIVQYRVGHREAMRRVMDDVHRKLPGVTLAGAHLSGVSVADACLSGVEAARRCLAADAVAGSPS